MCLLTLICLRLSILWSLAVALVDHLVRVSALVVAQAVSSPRQCRLVRVRLTQSR
jgi:hypothetical protein